MIVGAHSPAAASGPNVSAPSFLSPKRVEAPEEVRRLTRGTYKLLGSLIKGTLLPYLIQSAACCSDMIPFMSHCSNAQVRAALHNHLMLEFALTMLHSAIRNGPLSNRCVCVREGKDLL